jgi:putative transposase
VIVALAVTRDGTKEPLGLCLGSTENAVICTQLLQDLLARGLRIDGRVLCVIDGGKGLRKALADVLGAAAVLQRCQLHKRRNLEALIPKARHAYLRTALQRAYRASSAAAARRQLQALGVWLEHTGHPDAAASLREGLEDTLTVLKLGLSPTLRRKRWRGGEMIRRWVGLGLGRAAACFRRIKGHRDLATLAAVLRAEPSSAHVA